MRVTECAVAGTVRQGVMKLGPQRHVLEQLIKQLPDGDYVIRVEPATVSRRSLDQNAYLHAVPFRILAEHTGYTVPEIKLLLMGECFGWSDIGGHQVPVKPETHKLTREECTYFIDWVIPWAAEQFDVLIPLPSEDVR